MEVQLSRRCRSIYSPALTGVATGKERTLKLRVFPFPVFCWEDGKRFKKIKRTEEKAGDEKSASDGRSANVCRSPGLGGRDFNAQRLQERRRPRLNFSGRSHPELRLFSFRLRRR